MGDNMKSNPTKKNRVGSDNSLIFFLTLVYALGTGRTQTGVHPFFASVPEGVIEKWRETVLTYCAHLFQPNSAGDTVHFLGSYPPKVRILLLFFLLLSIP